MRFTHLVTNNPFSIFSLENAHASEGLVQQQREKDKERERAFCQQLSSIWMIRPQVNAFCFCVRLTERKPGNFRYWLYSFFIFRVKNRETRMVAVNLFFCLCLCEQAYWYVIILHSYSTSARHFLHVLYIYIAIWTKNYNQIPALTLFSRHFREK